MEYIFLAYSAPMIVRIRVYLLQLINNISYMYKCSSNLRTLCYVIISFALSVVKIYNEHSLRIRF